MTVPIKSTNLKSMNLFRCPKTKIWILRHLLTECSHSLKVYNFGTSGFQGLFLSFPILILSSSLSLSLTPPSLSLSLILYFQSPSFSLPLTPPSISLSLSLTHSPFSLSFSLSASFPPLLSFHLRLFNLFDEHSPSPLSSRDYYRCTNSLCFLCTERTVMWKFESHRQILAL